MTVDDLKPEELALYDAVTELGMSLWSISAPIKGMSNDPLMISVVLFKRIYTNHQAFTLLWKNGLYLEAEIVLRSALEAAICIAANRIIRADFEQLIRVDAAWTVSNQAKKFRKAGNDSMAEDAEETLESIKSRLPQNTKLANLSWDSLAEQGEVPDLYLMYKVISGFSAHIGGFSMQRDIVAANLPDHEAVLNGNERRQYLLWMTAAMLAASSRHAEMVGALKDLETAIALNTRLAAVLEHL